MVSARTAFDESKQTLLWITPKWPFPTNDGARLATRHLLEPLTERGVAIHLCTIVPHGEEVDTAEAIETLGVRSVRVVRRRPSVREEHVVNALTRPLTPITFAPYGTRSVAAQILPLCEQHPDAPIVFDGLHAAAWIDKRGGARLTNPLIYRAHNVERDIWLRGGDQARGPRRLLLKEQGWLVGRFEADITRRSALTLPVSDDDSAIFRGWSDDVVTVPIGLEARSMVPVPEEPLRILFVGRLDWPPNRDGLTWILESVWPEVMARRPDLSMDIVGSGDGSWLERFANLPGITLRGRVDSLEPWYAGCAASLVPVFFGSGTRVKAIEASLYGRVCISTAVGVEGLRLRPGQEYLRAESAEEWIEALSQLTRDQAASVGQAAAERASERFERTNVADALIDELHARTLIVRPD